MQILLILKPDCLKRRLQGQALRELLKDVKDCNILAMRQSVLGPGVLKELYWEHRDQVFFEPLIKQMQSGPCVLCRVECTSVETIRAWVFGFRTKWRDPEAPSNQNLLHASDSVASGERELRLFPGSLKCGGRLD